MKRKIGMIFVVILILVAIVGVVVFLMIGKTKKKDLAVFSWFQDALTDDELTNIAKNNEITQIYQLFSSKYSEQDCLNFANKMSENKISVYGLCGEMDWAKDESAKYMLEEISLIKKYNEKLEEKSRIKGIVFDVEPYNLPEWKIDKDAIMESFTKALSKVYENREGLEILLCIPYYYDEFGYENTLEKWLSSCCDGFIVMNYYVGKEQEHISTELNLCKKYNKKIISAYELQPNDENEIKNVNTYYGKSLQEVKDNFYAMDKVYKYSNLGYALHELRIVKDMKRKI